MHSQQLSFWDNEALETGYRHLAALEFEEAQQKFNKALQAGIGETDSIKKLLDACEYWKVRIPSFPQIKGSSELIDSLLTGFVNYPFTPQMHAFKEAMLAYIVSLLHNEPQMNIKSMETAFDLLIESNDLTNAESLAQECVAQHAGNRFVLYLLAQVQWLSGNRSEANNHYAMLLLQYPGEVEFNRIENFKLKELINLHGAAMAPAYGWLQNAMPFVPVVNEIIAGDAAHQKAIACYRLLRDANKSLLNNEIALAVQKRKELKSIAPELFAEYFNWLKQRR